MRELFIYYRTQVLDEVAFKAAATALQTELQTRFDGLQTRLLRRPEAVDELHTWMETYALLAPLDTAGRPCRTGALGITDAMHHAIEAAASASLGRWIVGARHVEVFDACA